MKSFDFGVSCVYSKDVEFVKILKTELRKKRISFYEVNYNNFDSVIKLIELGQLKFKVFVDLSSFEHPIFMALSEKLSSKGTIIINDSPSIISCFNKTKLHNLFEKNNLPVRKTFIISPDKYTKTQLNNVVKILKPPFVLSQAVSALEGGIVLNAKEVEDITNFLENYPTEDCLAHEYVLPSLIQGKVAWFRVIYACGKIIPHWWDPQNTFYRRFGKSIRELRINFKLKSYLKKVSELTGLKLFSTEIIINHDKKYIIVDYANHPIDLSSQEYERDGVPVESLKEIASALVDVLKK